MARVHLQILLALEGWTDAEGILSVEERVNPRERPSHQSKLTIKYYQSFGTTPVMLYLFVDSPHWLYQYIYKSIKYIYIRSLGFSACWNGLQQKQSMYIYIRIYIYTQYHTRLVLHQLIFFSETRMAEVTHYIANSFETLTEHDNHLKTRSRIPKITKIWR